MVGQISRFGLGALPQPVRLGALVLLSVLTAGPAQAATFTVTNTNDSGAGSLRAAMLSANGTAGADIIAFDIPGAGVQTISPISSLPNVIDPVTIDGTTQPGYSGTPLIELNAAGAGPHAFTLTLNSSGTTIKGLIINRSPGIAIRLFTSNNVIVGNYLGTDPTGTVASPNAAGVFIQASNNRVGGTAVADRNVISGNDPDGIQITGAGATGNLVEGNYIGLDAAGTADLGNANTGVAIYGSAANNTVGGAVAGAGNVISGNNLYGVGISQAGTTGNRVEGNRIGTNAAGTAAIGNAQGVATLSSATGNTIGGTAAGAGNVISGNNSHGITVGAGSTQILGNYVGTNAAGTAAVPNGVDGISIQSSSNSTVGDTTAAGRNVVSGNADDGIEITGAASTGNVVQGNYVGLNAAGTGAVGNANDGIVVWLGQNNTIGGTAAGAGNVVGGNQSGIYFGQATATGNVIQGNLVGTNAAGTAAVPNITGIYLDLTPTTVGGTAAGARNVISGNTWAGLWIAGASGVVVQGNFIGTAADGIAALPNGRGIYANAGASNSTIGGTAAGAPNRIALNSDDAVEFAATVGAGNQMSANEIYSNGALGIDLGDDGVTWNDTGDGDTGPNNLQNFPVLSAATTNGAGSANFAGSLNGAASTAYRVEFFASGAADPGGYGEGQRYLGFTNVTTNAAGNAIIGVTLATSLTAGEFVTATAINPANSTSEFSAAIPASGALIVTTTSDSTTGSDTSSVSSLIATPGADGRISLREAILATNNTAGADTIRFGIPLTDAGHLYYRNDAIAGSLTNEQTTSLADSASASSPAITDFDPDYPAGFARSWYRIQPTSALPTVTGAVVIDATTQRGSLTAGPVVLLDGLNAGVANGLTITAGSSTVRGLVIHRFQQYGMSLGTGGGNTVAGNIVGLNVAGTTGLGNTLYGITMLGSNGNVIGGTSTADRNVISGNRLGVNVGATSQNELIQGNYIGTDVTGTRVIGNTFDGVWVQSNAGPSTIGGTAAGAGNLISGNGEDGVSINGTANGMVVQGNRIGTDVTGTLALGNALHGIHLGAGNNHVVGGSSAGAPNTISANTGAGVAVEGTSTGNSIVRNAIRANGGLGIDLNIDGVTANDALDSDTGPNNLLNFPQVTSAYPSAGTLTVYFRLDVPAGSYRVEFFKNPSGLDPTGYGEAQAFASAVNVTHPGGGARFFNHTFAGNAGDVITTTATACTDGAVCSAFGSTSEISNGATAGTTAVKLISFTATPGDQSVELHWQTGSELDNLGFHLHRGLSKDGPWTRLTSSLIPGLGSSPLGQAYSWQDTGLTNEVRYYYRLEDVDTASRSTFHGPVSTVPSPQGEDGDGGGGGDGTEGGGEGPGADSCPAWVLAAAPDTVSPACTKHGDPDSVSFQVLSRDARTATLELRTGGFWTLEDTSVTVRVFVPGFDFPSDPKAPALPLRRALVPAVVGKQVHLVSAEAFGLQSFPGLRPSAEGRAEMALGRDGTVRPARRAVPARFLSHGMVPAQVARLVGAVFQGERKSAVVEMVPVRFFASRNELVLASRVRVKLSFAGVAAGEVPTGAGGRVLPRKGQLREVLAHLHTTKRGLHAMRYEDLFPTDGRGVLVTLLRLQRQGQAVPFQVKPSGTVFGPGSVLYFFGDRTVSSTEYSPEVAYELVRGSGVRMGVTSAPPLSGASLGSSTGYASFETNRVYQPGLPEAADIWLWDGMASGVARTKSFTLSGVDAAASEQARLVVLLQGGSESGFTTDHHVSVSVNGGFAGEATFAGKRPYGLEVSIPASLLREGANELSVTNVGDTGVSSLVFLDRFELRYPQVSTTHEGVFEGVWAEGGTVNVSGVSGPPIVLDVTGAAKWVTDLQATGSSVRFQAAAGHRYVVVSSEGLLSPRVGRVPPSTLRAGTNQADYLVIAPREFLEAALPLVERRREQGLVSRGVSFEEIASEFGHGRPSAEAIRAFLEYAYHSWERPSPRYVVLLGDATYDPRHFLTTSWASPLPALWTKTSYLWTASDPALAAVNGEDLLPDVAIGRLPATSREQAEALVAKLLAWEDSGQGLGGNAVLVADKPDAGGDFEWDVEDIRQTFLATRATTTLKVRELGAATRTAILGVLDDGASMMSYVGHGGTAVWSSSNVLNSWDPPSLLAQGRQPFLLTMNCLNGYFVAPNFDSLSESLVKVEGRGAVAAFSPSGLSLDGPAHQYHRALMAELVSGAHERLGDAVLAAQRTYAETGLMPELLVVYQLLGDPATKVR